VKAKPEIFEDLDDELFNQLPANYRLLKKIDTLPANLSESEGYKTVFFSCEPITKPISKILTGPKGARGEN
jgi:hypothetical protein